MTSPSRSGDHGQEFVGFLKQVGKRVERILDRALETTSRHPRVVYKAMRYTALSGGKRLRPALVVLSYQACGGRGRKADPVGAAVEMVHAFSLIHDDLPAMDDDDFRRGKPSNHKVFGEGVAILAGDGLLTTAFQTLAGQSKPSRLGPEITANLVLELSTATGPGGVIGGQVVDLLSEGTRVPRSTVTYIHEHKTARLFAASLRLGALAAGAGRGEIQALTRYGNAAGTAFQIVDDILGAAGTVKELGRDPGRDQARGKVTYPAVAGFPASHRAVDRLLAGASGELKRFPEYREQFLGFLDLIDQRRLDAGGRKLGLARNK